MRFLKGLLGLGDSAACLYRPCRKLYGLFLVYCTVLHLGVAGPKGIADVPFPGLQDDELIVIALFCNA